jgi:hypothetical protein
MQLINSFSVADCIFIKRYTPACIDSMYGDIQRVGRGGGGRGGGGRGGGGRGVGGNERGNNRHCMTLAFQAFHSHHLYRPTYMCSTLHACRVLCTKHPPAPLKGLCHERDIFLIKV